MAAVQADVDANEAASDAAEAALSGRLDTLEADPTTATALAAVQADVDQNEADADAAIALRAPIDAPTFTGDVTIGSGAFYKESNERLGLGTTTPGGALHVVHGSVNAVFQRNGGSSKLLIKPNTTDDGMTIQGQSNSGNSIILDTVGGSAAVKFTNNDNGTIASFGSSITLSKEILLSNGLTDAADDAAAASAGVAVGQIYRNGSIVMIRVS